MPRLALTATFVVAALLATACAGDDTSGDPDLLVAAAASFQQVACEPVPLQLINTRTGETRLGPLDRYVGVAVSPSADRVAAIRLDWNLCDPDDEAQSDTFTVLLIDVATFEVTKLSTTDETTIYLHWSPDAKYLAVVGADSVTTYETDTPRKLTSTPLQLTPASVRSHIVWPESGPFLFMYSAGNTLIGQRRDTANTYERWTFECPGYLEGSFERIHPSGSKEATIDYYCRDSSLQPSHWRRVVLDLDDGTLSDSIESDAYPAWLDQFSRFQDLIDTRYPGGEIHWDYLTDATGTLDMLSVTHSPGGHAISSVSRWKEGLPADVQTAIAIRNPNGAIIYVPVDITPTKPDYNIGPLYDVAILPD